jgi:hypothetical protein
MADGMAQMEKYGSRQRERMFLGGLLVSVMHDGEVGRVLDCVEEEEVRLEPGEGDFAGGGLFDEGEEEVGTVGEELAVDVATAADEDGFIRITGG